MTFQSFVRKKASTSYTCAVRYQHTNAGLRSRNWRTATAYPSPAPLMSREVVDTSTRPTRLADSEEDDTKATPRKPLTKLSRANREFPDEWRAHRAAVREAHPEGWAPPKKLSREAMDGMRFMHKQNPEVFGTPILAEKFKISPEAVRRILRSKWEPSRDRKVELAIRDQSAARERFMKARLEETQSRVEAMNEKLSADRENSDRFWKDKPIEDRLAMESLSQKRLERQRMGRSGPTGAYPERRRKFNPMLDKLVLSGP